jgi:hypothetical protein
MTFFRYARYGEFFPLFVMPSTNNHFLNSALMSGMYNIFGPHDFFLRLPNIIAFLAYSIAVYRISLGLKSISSKWIWLTLAFLNFYFLDFFELARGYGLSMACIMMGIYQLKNVFEMKSVKAFNICLFWFQFAVCANLTFLSSFAFIVSLFFLFILFYARSFGWKKCLYLFLSILVQVALIVYWLKVVFFYKENNAIDFGVGDSYWEVTFKTLIRLLYGGCPLWLSSFLAACMLLILGTFVYENRTAHKAPGTFFSLRFFVPFLLFSMIILFFLQKKILDIYFPSERAALLLYPFYVLAFSLATDRLPKKLRGAIAFLIIGASLVNFFWRMNFYTFSSNTYWAAPKHFFEKMKEEQKKSDRLLTFSGSELAELLFNYQNFQEGSPVNPMNKSGVLQMFSDYAVTAKFTRSFFNKWYVPIDSDEVTSIYLIKRRKPLNRVEIFSSDEKKEIDIIDGFHFLHSWTDTTYNGIYPLELEIDFEMIGAPQLGTTHMIALVRNEKNEIVTYSGTNLNLLSDIPSEKRRKLKILTGTMPMRVNDMNVHLWHQWGKRYKFILHGIKVYQLKDEAVTYLVPWRAYEYINKLHDDHLK